MSGLGREVGVAGASVVVVVEVVVVVVDVLDVVVDVLVVVIASVVVVVDDVVGGIVVVSPVASPEDPQAAAISDAVAHRATTRLRRLLARMTRA